MSRPDGRRTLRVALVVVGLLALASIVPRPLADATQDDRVDDGARLYSVYCANCHGLSAKGDGPTARYLTVPPPDLTALARKNGGEFPRDDVRRAIDGRETVRTHGEREMPIWGLAFQSWDADANQEEEVRSRIDKLVAYLEALQDD